MASRAPLFARSGQTSPFGKLIDLGKCRVHDEAADVVKQAAARARLPVAEYLRNYIEIGHLGRAEIERRQTLVLNMVEVAIPKRDTTGSSE